MSNSLVQKVKEALVKEFPEEDIDPELLEALEESEKLESLLEQKETSFREDFAMVLREFKDT